MATKKKVTNTKKVIKKEIIDDEEKEIETVNKKKEKTNYKAAIIVGVIAVFVILLIISNYENKEATAKTDDTATTSEVDIKDYTTAATVEEYLTMKADSEVNIFYIARPTCSYCVKFAPILASVIDEYKLTVNYINIDETENQSRIADINDSSAKLDGFGTPTIAITQNGEVTYANIGYIEKEELITFLTDSGIIK